MSGASAFPAAALPPGPPTLAILTRLAWPVVLSRLGIMAMGVTDAIVVGRYSAQELAYQSLGWGPTMVIVTTGVGLLFGVQVLTAQLVGEHRRKEAGAALQRGLLLSVIVGGIVALIMGAGADPIMRLLGFENDLGRGAANVMAVLAYSMPLYLVGVTAAFWLEALERPIPGMWVMWGANILNLALNLWLVPGTSPFAVSGAVASAWTTLFSRGVYALGLLAVILFWSEARGLGVFILRRAVSLHTYWGRLMRIGSATALSYFVESVGFAAMIVMVGWLGGNATATYAIIFNLAGLMFMFPLGISTATAVLTGEAFGEGSHENVRRAGLLGIGISVALLLALSILIVPLRDGVVGLYTDDLAIRGLAAPILVLGPLFFPLDGMQVVAAAALRGMEDAWVPTLTHIISYTLVMLPLGYLLAHALGYGLFGIMWTMIIASVAASAFLFSRFLWLTRRSAALPAAA